MLQIEPRSAMIVQREDALRHSDYTRAPRLAPRDEPALDSLQLSDDARAAASEDDGIRDAYLQRIRAEIEAGRYLTTEKLNIAAEALRRDVHGGR